MHRQTMAILAFLSIAMGVWAAAPTEIQVQGLYEGSTDGAIGKSRLEVRVVAQGDGHYRVLVRQFLADEKIVHAELTGKTEGEQIIFGGKIGDVAWQGVYSAGTIKGECGKDSTFQVNRYERNSETLGRKPPEGAIVLLGEKGVEKMVRANGSEWYLGDMSKHGWPVWEVPLYAIAEKDPAAWPTSEKPIPEGWVLSKERRRADMVIGVDNDGSIQVPKGGMNSADEFEGSFDLHVEIQNPFQPNKHSQGRGNSGCYLPNGDEIQVLDSFGECTYEGGCAGGFYRYHNPHCMEVIESIENKARTSSTWPPTRQAHGRPTTSNTAWRRRTASTSVSRA